MLNVIKRKSRFENMENLKTIYSKHHITEVAEKRIEKRYRQNIIKKKSVIK